ASLTYRTISSSRLANLRRPKNEFSYSFFFFSSRRRHTRFSRDWSSDVCSSDLANIAGCGTGAPCRAGQSPGLITGEELFRTILEIGRASCRERVEISEEDGLMKK